MSTIDLSKGSYTYADLECLPEDERSHYELSYGALVVTPAPNLRHQHLLGQVVILLNEITLPSQVVLPEADLLLAQDLVKRPDIQMVDRDLASGQYVAGVPELVVEILSPATRKIDLTEKRSVYEEAGIKAYWIVDPEVPELTVLELTPEGRYVPVEPDSAGRIEISVPVRMSVDPGKVTKTTLI
jgi:Uma2 family endonuclease